MEMGPILRAMGRNKVRFGLIVMEVALTLAIVANCVTMIRDARAKMTRASGFDDANLVRVNSTPFEKDFREEGYLDNALAADLRSLRSMPGVRAASNTRFLPWQGGGSSTQMRPAGGKGEMLRTQIYNADEHTLPGARHLGGRGPRLRAGGGRARHRAPARPQQHAARCGRRRPAPREVPAGGGRHPGVRTPRVRRRAAARQAARGLGRRPLPRGRGHRQLLQPLRLADPRVRGVLPELLARLRVRLRATCCAPSRARRPRSRRRSRRACWR